MSESLRQLAVAHGVALEYRDVWGQLRRADDDTLRGVLRAMHVDAGSEADVAQALRDIADARCSQCLPPMIVRRSNARPWQVPAYLSSELASRPLAWRVVSESPVGEARLVAAPMIASSGPFVVNGQTFVKCELGLEAALCDGYHAIDLVDGRRSLATATLAVAPPRCHRPPQLQSGRRLWGAAVQLYGVRSQRNFGIGDFTDLATLVEQWDATGADILGVNPLHALFPERPGHASPYSPSSRLFLNILYLDVQAVPEFGRCAEARRRVDSAEFQSALRSLRKQPLVDYEGVAAAKREILDLLYAQARREARRSLARS